MIQLTVLYGHPQDTEAFDKYYRETHIPIAQELPGLKGYIVHKPAAVVPGETSPYYLIAELHWENMEAFQAALQSAEGQAAADDLPNFASGGATLLVSEIEVHGPGSIG